MRTAFRPYLLLGSLTALVLVVVLAGDQVMPLQAVYAGTRSAAPEGATAPRASSAISMAAARLDVRAGERIDAPDASGTAEDAQLPPAPITSLTQAPTLVATAAPETAAPATAAPATPVPATPAPVVAVATPVPTAAPAATPSGCPATYFCYPRVGIRGQIVPYTDCSGTTDVGTAIRAYTCLSPNYLLGHAYTQMGNITGWQAGDVVYAYGKAYTIYNALTEQSCQPPILPLAPLSMQTSLSPYTCGPVLVVQAR